MLHPYKKKDEIMIVTYQSSNITVNKSAFINKRQDESVKIQNYHKNDLEPPPHPSKKKIPKTKNLAHRYMYDKQSRIRSQGFLFFWFKWHETVTYNTRQKAQSEREWFQSDWRSIIHVPPLNTDYYIVFNLLFGLIYSISYSFVRLFLPIIHKVCPHMNEQCGHFLVSIIVSKIWVTGHGKSREVEDFRSVGDPWKRKSRETCLSTYVSVYIHTWVCILTHMVVQIKRNYVPVSLEIEICFFF